MKNLFQFHRKILIGVVHLKPLPGAPRHRAGIGDIIKSAVADAVAYERGGPHAVFIENFGDVPFTKTNVGPETIAAMTAAGCAVRAAVKLPIGFNVLRNDACAAPEMLIIVSGTLEVHMEDKSETAEAGSIVYFSSNILHRSEERRVGKECRPRW